MMSVRETLVGFPLERNIFPEGSRLCICTYIRDIACTCTSSLFLNVWTPPGAKRTSKIPVMIWLYGGGFQLGASSHPEYDGARLAHRGERPRPPGSHLFAFRARGLLFPSPLERDAFSRVYTCGSLRENPSRVTERNGMSHACSVFRCVFLSFLLRSRMSLVEYCSLRPVLSGVPVL